MIIILCNTDKDELSVHLLIMVINKQIRIKMTYHSSDDTVSNACVKSDKRYEGTCMAHVWLANLKPDVRSSIVLPTIFFLCFKVTLRDAIKKYVRNIVEIWSIYSRIMVVG